jgi:dCMP deaminase
VIVKDRQILSTGYNGPPRGIEHCQVCYREEHNIPHGKMYETCKALHAEQNAMLQAARHGVSIKDADIYITGVPCIMCARMIINAGLRTVYVSNDSLAKEYITSLVLLHDIGINVIRVIE